MWTRSVHTLQLIHTQLPTRRGVGRLGVHCSAMMHAPVCALVEGTFFDANFVQHTSIKS